MTAPTPDPGALLDRLEDAVAATLGGNPSAWRNAASVVALPEVAALIAAARERDRLRTAVEELAEELLSAAELYDAAALDARMAFDLMAEGGHLIQAGDARRFADRLRAVVADTSGEA